LREKEDKDVRHGLLVRTLRTNATLQRIHLG